MHWVHGGPTSCDNGALLCERHHIAVHDGGFTVHRDPGTSRWHTHRPDGSPLRSDETARLAAELRAAADNGELLLA
ncbi:MAG: endonuclease [Modestobacter sp.]|nr:endonuclease [Modestobacter sp.]